MNTKAQRIAVATLAALLLSTVGRAQTPSAKSAPGEPKSRFWIVLLDASLSEEKRDEKMSQELGKPGYRLRNETLTLLQSLLASLSIREQGLEHDYLEVYVFGKEVRAITDLPDRPVDWNSVQTEEWWDQHVPQDIGSRTDYFAALQKAVDSFKSKHQEAEKKLILISDGELDVGPINRPSRGKLEPQEEVERYRNLLRPDAPLMNALTAREISVCTIALDDDLYGPNDVARQKEIEARLTETRPGDPSPLGHALAIIESLVGRVGPDGRLPYSEGPYVMRALADQFGGQAHSVSAENVLDVLWSTIFPDAQSHRIVVPPGTRQVIAFAPLDTPVLVKLVKDGRPQEVRLRYDSQNGGAVVEPREARADVTPQVHPTSQFANWVIESPYLAEVSGLPGAQEIRQLSLVPVPNVRFEWRDQQPPERTLAGTVVPLGLDLEWQVDPATGKNAPEWRRLLRQATIEAHASVTPPGGDPRPVTLHAEVPPDDDRSPVVLKLAAPFEATHKDGAYEVTADLVVGTPPDAWELKAPPVRFRAFAESPLSDPERFALVVRPFKREALGGPVRISPPGQGGDGPVELTVERPPRVVFEWRANPAKGCSGAEQLQIELPAIEHVLGPRNDDLPDHRPISEDGQLVCYRSVPEGLGDAAFAAPLRVRASDGLTNWERSLRVKIPLSTRAKILLGCGGLLLLLLFAAAAALALIPALRRRLRRWYVLRQAPFSLAAEWEGRRLAWEGGPKRLLVTFGPRGASAEFTHRMPAPGQAAVEILPNSAQDYRIGLVSAPPPTLRKIAPPGSGSPPPARPVHDGELVSRTEFLRGTRLEFAHGAARVTIVHKAR
jgi:hypothetical protein